MKRTSLLGAFTLGVLFPAHMALAAAADGDQNQVVKPTVTKVKTATGSRLHETKRKKTEVTVGKQARRSAQQPSAAGDAQRPGKPDEGSVNLRGVRG